MSKWTDLITYQDDTYIDLWQLVKRSPYRYFIFIGGRGIGKTYSILKGLLLDNSSKFIYMRNTDEELKLCMNEEDNPFRDINHDFGTDFVISGQKKSPVIIDNEKGEVVGLARALSVSGNVRGSSFSDIDYLLFEEFISYSVVKGAYDKKKANLFFNMIETINRNRENKGKEGIKVILLANAQTLDDDIIRTLRIGDVFYSMIQNNEHYREIPERDLFISWLASSQKFVDMKSRQSLYRLTKGTNFYEMAINNQFTMDYFGDVKKVSYTELEPVVAYDKLYFYIHKTGNFMFASYRKSNCRKYDETTFKAFRKDYGLYLGTYIERGKMLYISYNCKLDVLHIF